MNIQQNSLRAWWLATRPKTLSAALTPIATATALAYANGFFHWQPAVLCFLFAALMQIAANFINDLYDFLKGTDGEDRLGPERACAQGWISVKAMKIGIFCTILLASSIGLCLLSYGSTILIGIGAACIIFAFLYTTLLSYCGLGDILVYVFFGLVAVGATYFIQTGSMTADVWWLSAAIGLSTDTLLVLNNYRDRDTDAISGKRTLVVVFGERFGSLFYLCQGIMAAISAAIVLGSHTPWTISLVGIYLGQHIYTWYQMITIYKGRELNRILGTTSKNMLILGTTLVIGLLA